jgi:hypothetical protein
MIEIKLVITNVCTRWHCHVCGDRTELDTVLCEGSGDETPFEVVRVCPECLKSPDSIDEKIEQQASDLEYEAMLLRSLKGNLKLPTYEEWARATEKHQAEIMEIRKGLSR